MLALAAVLVTAAFAAAPAAAAPCWQKVIEDWHENSRVDNRYPIHCYRQALANLPEDMRAYSSAPDDISRAMRAELARQNTSGENGQTSTEAAGTPPTGTGGGEGTQGGEEPSAPAVDPDLVVETPSSGVVNEAIDELGPSNVSSLPLPLIILAAAALLLMAAGAAGILARRIQAGRFPPGKQH